MLIELQKHLNQKEITLVVGARQAGKTTLMLELKNQLEAAHKKTLWFNLDYEGDKVYFDSQDKLLRKIELEFGKDGGIVFIDEMQRKENAGIFLKGIYDLGKPYKFVISGSGSLELKEKIHESLAGRKRMFELGPVSLWEFIGFKTDYRYTERMSDFFASEPLKRHTLLTEYLRFGGYPRVILAESLSEKQKLIKEIYQSYVEKDIAYLLRINRLESFNKLVGILASQIGQLVNYGTLAQLIGVSTATLKHYLWYLEKTFIIKMVKPYFTNARKEITKAPMIYFNDLGMRNFSLGRFSMTADTSHAGFLFQNVVANELQEAFADDQVIMRFWRSTDKAEVDFVLSTEAGPVPLEVKCTELKKPELTRSLRSFIEKYSVKNAYVVNLNLSETLHVHQTSVHMIPWYDLLSLREDVVGRRGEGQ